MGGIKRLRKLIFLSQISKARVVRMQSGRRTFCPSFSCSEPRPPPPGDQWGWLEVGDSMNELRCLVVLSNGPSTLCLFHGPRSGPAPARSGVRGSGVIGTHPSPPAGARVVEGDGVGSRVPGSSVPARPLARPLAHLSSRPGSVPESPAGGGPWGLHPPPSLHPAAWFPGSAIQFREERQGPKQTPPPHSGRSTASADGLASALPVPPAPRGRV